MKSGRKPAPQSLIKHAILQLVFVCTLWPHALPATQALRLEWDPVPSPFVSGYRLHYGTKSKTYDTQVDAGTNVTVTLSGLADGTLYFFAVTAYNAYRDDGDYSAEVYHLTAGTNKVSAFVHIVQPPRQQAVTLGSNATFSVVATGGGTLTYHWHKNGLSLGGSNSAHLTLKAVTEADGGSYSVVVQNELGLEVSHPVPLRVIIPLRLESAARLPDGSMRLTIGNSDGSAVKPSQVFRFGVEASTDLRSTDAWTPLTNSWSFKDGCCVMEDPQSLNLPQRYYRSVDSRGFIGPLRVAMPERTANGDVRLRARLDATSRGLTPGEVAFVRFEATENPAAPDSWVPLTQTPQLLNGEAVVEDGDSHLWSKRFYRVVVDDDAGSPVIRLQVGPPDSDHVFRVRLSRADGGALTALDMFNYEVWVKTNLLSNSGWQLLSSPFTLTNGKLIVTDTAAAASPVRLYRVYAR